MKSFKEHFLINQANNTLVFQLQKFMRLYYVNVNRILLTVKILYNVHNNLLLPTF